MNEYYKWIQDLLSYYAEGMVTKTELEMKLLDLVEKAYLEGKNAGVIAGMKITLNKENA